MSARRLAWAAFALLAVASGAFFAWRAVRVPSVTITLVPGRSIWEVADKLAGAGLGTRDEVLSLATDEAWLRGLGVPTTSRVDSRRTAATALEGFVYPETYAVPMGGPSKVVLERAVRQFSRVWEELRSRHADRVEALADEFGLTDFDLVTLASLVEEEMALRSEAPRIAGVFLNRLRKDMRLETDPTLMYRPDRVGRPPTPAERRDRSNPYNTYAYKGLPPGPICSPGRDALLGVLTAERHNYLFFVAKRDGSRSHAFAVTYEDHEANIDRYLGKKPKAP